MVVLWLSSRLMVFPLFSQFWFKRFLLRRGEVRLLGEVAEQALRGYVLPLFGGPFKLFLLFSVVMTPGLTVQYVTRMVFRSILKQHIPLWSWKMKSHYYQEQKLQKLSMKFYRATKNRRRNLKSGDEIVTIAVLHCYLDESRIFLSLRRRM